MKSKDQVIEDSLVSFDKVRSRKRRINRYAGILRPANRRTEA
jgi:hypothetical protein